MQLLKVEDLKMYYQTSSGSVKAIDNISFTIDKGETLGLVGESGCGKTSLGLTLLRMPNKPGKIESGKIMLEGNDILTMSEETVRKDIRFNKISMVFQGAMNSLTPVYTIEELMTETLLQHRVMEKSEIEKLIIEYLGYVGLNKETAKRYPHELSGGMKQRVVIACALFLKPKLVILDEPTTALDVIVQAQIINLLKKLKKEFELSYIFITHDLSLEAEIADKIAVISAGEIVELANNNIIYGGNAKHPYTEKLLASTPKLESRNDALEFIEGTPPDLLSNIECCRFYERCHKRIDKCKTEKPTIKEIGKNHFCMCHLV